MSEAGGKGSSSKCDDKCGCPSPCVGGNTCKCEPAEHKACSCGEHCGCNPCNCAKEKSAGTGKAFCKCGTGCSCTTCGA